MDRASIFADEEVISLLSSSFVPVAVDEWYHVRRKDDEGRLYRKIVYQRDGLSPDRDATTQGFYIFTPDGKLLRGWNNRDVPRAKRYLREVLGAYRPGPPSPAGAAPAPDPRLARSPPRGGAVVDVFTRITEADWPPARKDREGIFRSSTGRDHLWITAPEVEALAGGRMPESLTRRIARWHLVDNTRGEPPHWRKSEVREASIRGTSMDGALRIEGKARLETETGDRGYDVDLLGQAEVKGGKLERFDLVARGSFHGEGTYTRGAPPGKFTLAIAFTLAPPGEASHVPPQGARDLEDYLAD